MTLKEIQTIIKDFEKSELTILELEYKDIKLKLSKNKNDDLTIKEMKSNYNNTTSEQNIIVPKINIPEGEIRSPLVGTFYSASSPESDPYVNVGDKVKKGDVVCIVEAMKIMNEITAETEGVITDIHFDNGDAVGFDDVLFTVKSNEKK